MELCDDNLSKVLRNRSKGFEPEEIFKIMGQLNETFKIMEKKKIVHRDIKLENILVKFKDGDKKDFIVKLTDYGISKQISSKTMIKTAIGTKYTMAPEIFEGLEYNNKCDLWSIGVIIYQLAFKEFPYSGHTEVVILNNIKTFKHKKLKKSGDKNLDDLIRKLLVYEVDKRISWDDYFNHPFFCLKQKIQKIDIMEEELEKPAIPCKVVLVGESGVGKKSIISRYLTSTFNSTSLCTPGANFTTKTIFLEEYNQSIKFEIWDTAG